jgi:hypothetical protein
MLIKLPTIASISITLLSLGVGLLVIPYDIGFPVLFGGLIIGGWAVYGWWTLRQLRKLIGERVHVTFLKADFKAIGMSSPYIDFYFNLRNCLPYRLMLTNQKKGELYNPYIEPWYSNWLVDTQYQDIVMPDTDTEIRIRWPVSQGYNSPMTEFAFRAKDNPPEQRLAFEGMSIELKARILKFEGNIGWLQLPQGIILISVPDHPVFDAVRREYLRRRGSK